MLGEAGPPGRQAARGGALEHGEGFPAAAAFRGGGVPRGGRLLERLPSRGVVGGARAGTGGSGGLGLGLPGGVDVGEVLLSAEVVGAARTPAAARVQSRSRDRLSTARCVKRRQGRDTGSAHVLRPHERDVAHVASVGCSAGVTRQPERAEEMFPAMRKCKKHRRRARRGSIRRSMRFKDAWHCCANNHPRGAASVPCAGRSWLDSLPKVTWDVANLRTHSSECVHGPKRGIISTFKELLLRCRASKAIGAPPLPRLHRCRQFGLRAAK